MYFIVTLFVGCATEIGNPEGTFEGNFAALARTTDDAAVGIELGTGTIVSSAVVTLREVRFDAAERCDKGVEKESEIEGPWTVDLVRAAALPIKLVDKQFCRLRLRLDRAEEGPLDDVSIELTGERSDGTAFVLRSRDTPSVELRAKDDTPFEITGASDQLLLAFDMATWLSFDLDALIVGADGTILIDDDKNGDALDEFEDAVEESLELFDDRDGDGAVGVQDVPLASGR